MTIDYNLNDSLIKKLFISGRVRKKKKLTRWQSPTPLRVPFTSQRQSGMRKWMRGKMLWKYRAGSTVNRLWLQDFVTFTVETPPHKPPLLSVNLQRSSHQTCRGDLLQRLGFQRSGEKKETSCSQPKGFLRYYFFRGHGSDNIIATEQSCNIR